MLKKGKKGRRDDLSEFDDKEKKNQNEWTNSPGSSCSCLYAAFHSAPNND